VIAVLPDTLTAQPQSQTQTAARSASPSMRELTRISPTGNYLAARHAGAQRDATAAALFFRAALRTDPRNPELLERAFLATLAEGDMEEAIRLAERIVQIDRSDRIARMVLGIRALKLKQYAQARQQFGLSTKGPITDLTGTILTAWALEGANDSKGAVENIDRLSGPDWYPLFKELHAGLILDLAGSSKKEAGKHFERISAQLAVVASGRGLRQLALRNGAKEDALKVFTTFDAVLPRHPLILQAIARIKGDKGEASSDAAPIEAGLLRPGQKGEGSGACRSRSG
jgi:tetratricopeptide (TPR) repeat protein